MLQRSNPVSRNYAEALLALATKADNREGFAAMIRDVANAITQDATVRLFLESPRVSYEKKNELLSKAFGDRVPRVFLRFLQTLVRNRRQTLIPSIATEYASLLDEAEGRVHADVTVARAVDDAGTRAIAAQLSRALGKTVVPHVSVDAAIMGGVVVKIGDTVMDGSVRRRLSRLAQRMRVAQ
ncbi:MAG TPA: ATP synthase F1 subunit delta [Candidatus Elarobacter sp.]|nr:ATP synthase F1 subunit delta [Candidatus Elarobacter sp.]